MTNKQISRPDEYKVFKFLEMLRDVDWRKLGKKDIIREESKVAKLVVTGFLPPSYCDNEEQQPHKHMSSFKKYILDTDEYSSDFALEPKRFEYMYNSLSKILRVNGGLSVEQIYGILREFEILYYPKGKSSSAGQRKSQIWKLKVMYMGGAMTAFFENFARKALQYSSFGIYSSVENGETVSIDGIISIKKKASPNTLFAGPAINAERGEWLNQIPIPGLKLSITAIGSKDCIDKPVQSLSELFNGDFGYVVIKSEVGDNYLRYHFPKHKSPRVYRLNSTEKLLAIATDETSSDWDDFVQKVTKQPQENVNNIIFISDEWILTRLLLLFPNQCVDLLSGSVLKPSFSCSLALQKKAGEAKIEALAEGVRGAFVQDLEKVAGMYSKMICDVLKEDLEVTKNANDLFYLQRNSYIPSYVALHETRTVEVEGLNNLLRKMLLEKVQKLLKKYRYKPEVDEIKYLRCEEFVDLLIPIDAELRDLAQEARLNHKKYENDLAILQSEVDDLRQELKNMQNRILKSANFFIDSVDDDQNIEDDA